jgi:protein MpaA
VKQTFISGSLNRHGSGSDWASLQKTGPASPDVHVPERSLSAVLAPLEHLARTSASLIQNHCGHFEVAGREYLLPPYLYVGPRSGGEPIRIGLFAGIHGDEPEGTYALLNFVQLLEKQPDIAKGYCLFLYPVCNPSGFESRTRNSISGRDLNREFWSGTQEPEVRMLQSEILLHALDGLVSLHSDDTSNGFYGFARGATLTRHLLKPALEAAAAVLPVNSAEVIDGFHARDGIIRKGYPGMLSAPPGVRPRPFEILLEAPAQAPTYLKEEALLAALRSILVTYREFIAYAPNL